MTYSFKYFCEDNKFDSTKIVFNTKARHEIEDYKFMKEEDSLYNGEFHQLKKEAEYYTYRMERMETPYNRCAITFRDFSEYCNDYRKAMSALHNVGIWGEVIITATGAYKFTTDKAEIQGARDRIEEAKKPKPVPDVDVSELLGLLQA
tara:strand:+ start:192 stop:635 length:444 start_codon:yes stop_codon:yes gene_type:complete